MADRRHVKSAVPGGQIFDPAEQDILPPEGRVVTWSNWWERLRLRGGEIEVSDAPEPAPPPLEPPAEDLPPTPEAPPRGVRTTPQKASRPGGAD